MRPTGIYDWFANTQSWPQESFPPPEKISHLFPLHRQNSNTESMTSRSVGESTKRRSRAEAMWCLEGRARGNSSSTFATSVSDPGYDRFYEDLVHLQELNGDDDNDDDGKDDEDPWKDPWENAIKNKHGAKDAGRGYAQAQDVHMVAFEPLSSHHKQSSPQTQERSGSEKSGLPPSRLDHRRETDILLSLPPTTTRHQAQARLDRLSNPYKLPSPLKSAAACAPSPFKPTDVHTPTLRSLKQPVFLDGGPTPERVFPNFLWNFSHRETDYALDRFLHSPTSKPLPTFSPRKQTARISTVEHRKPDFTQNAREVLGWDRKSLAVWPEKLARRDAGLRAGGGGDRYVRYDELEDALHDVELKEEGEERRSRSMDGKMIAFPLNAKFWLQVLGLGLTFFNIFGVVFSFGLWMLYYTAERQKTPGEAGWSIPGISLVGSTQLALLFAIPLPISRVLDKRNRHYRAVLTFGITIMSLGLLCASWCISLGTIWICQGLLVGTGMGLILSCVLPTARGFFEQADRRIELLLGLTMASAPLGGIFYILISRALLKNVGFANTMRVQAGLVFALLLPIFFFIAVPQTGRHGISPRPRVQHERLLATIPQQNEKSPADILKTFSLLLISLVLPFPLFYLSLSSFPTISSSSRNEMHLLIYLLLGTFLGHLTLALLQHRLPASTIDIPILTCTILMSTAVWIWLAYEKNEAVLVAVAWTYGLGSSGLWRWVFRVLLGISPRDAGSRLEEWSSFQTRSGRMEVKGGGWEAGGIAVAMLVGLPICEALVEYGREKGLGHGFVEVLGFAGGVLGVAMFVMALDIGVKWRREKKKGTL